MRLALRESASGETDHGEFDPHVWFDPTNVMVWTAAIEETMVELDPGDAAGYTARAQTYRQALADLDLWIWARISSVPHDRRNLVTDHLAFAYYAARYGLSQVGSAFPGISTLMEPSARDIADLIVTIETLDVPAVFVGTTANASLAGTIAADTGTRVISLYTGSLSESDGPASTYIEFMRYDTEAMVGGLLGE